ncbi:hypothetical protein [Sorangium sp. So ce542]
MRGPEPGGVRARDQREGAPANVSDADGRRYTSELRMVTCFGPDTRVGL